MGGGRIARWAGETTWRHRLLGALFLTLAIFSHHFTAMGAALITRDPTILVVASALPPESMAVGVAIAGFAILALTLTGVWLDQRDRRRTAAFLRDMAAAKKAEEQQNLLIAELDHRVKNLLARVAVVAQRTRESSHSMDQFLAVLDGRIQSMANTHTLLSRGRWRGVPLADLVRRELEPCMGVSNVTAEGPDVVLSTEATQALAMVLHELVTNAAKYGALSVPRGQVSVRWGYRPNGSARATLAIDWQETGGPAVRVPTRCGFGTSVIRDLIPYELRGTVELSYFADGVRCRIELPCAQNLGRDQPSGFTGSHSLPLPAAGSQAATSH